MPSSSARPPRGLKALIVKSAPARKTVGKKKTGFRTGRTGRGGTRLRGITRLLETCLWSKGPLPHSAVRGGEYRGGAWSGKNGGSRRGSAVDAQVCRLASLSASARRSARKLKLTSLVFEALRHHGISPLVGQRVVADAARGLGTAIDLVGARKDELVVLELKCGYAGDRSAAGGRMQPPLASASDSILHRHLAQLAATTALFENETETVQKLAAKGIGRVSGALLYAQNDQVELHWLPSWWHKRGPRIVDRIAAGP